MSDKLEATELTASPKSPCDFNNSEIPDIKTFMESEEEGGYEAVDGCWVEADGLYPHRFQSWLLVLGLI